MKIISGTSPQLYDLEAKNKAGKEVSVHVSADGKVVQEAYEEHEKQRLEAGGFRTEERTTGSKKHQFPHVADGFCERCHIDADATQDRFIPSLTSPIALLARAPQAATANQVDDRQQSHGATPAQQRPGEREAIITGR